jgi:hypothetical protein
MYGPDHVIPCGNQGFPPPSITEAPDFQQALPSIWIDELASKLSRRDLFTAITLHGLLVSGLHNHRQASIYAVEAADLLLKRLDK